MSQYPGGPPPPPYYAGGFWPPPPNQPPYPPHHHPHHVPNPYPPPPAGVLYPPHDGGAVTAHPPYPTPYFVPGTMMIPVPVAPGPPPPEQPNNPTYITNYIYHGEGSSGNPALEPPPPSKSVEVSGEYEWVPTTATTAGYLTGQAVVGGHEGWDGSALWVIRAWHNGDLVPGKFSIRHNSASIMYDGKEIAVQNIEVLIAKPEYLRWIPASNGNVPPGAVSGGRTASGETLYVGRARHQLSITPGKVHPSHNSCYIGFAGTEVAHKMYDVLCRI